QIGAFSAGTETAATDHVVILFLSPGPVEKVTGPFVTVRATASVTLRAWEWTPVVPVLESSIPVGKYRIVGFRAQSDNLVAARIAVPGQAWRPGVLGTDTVSDIQHDRFRFGRAGVMIEFNTSEFFAVECLAAAADTSETFWFDLQKVE
ncbi:MAG: hypothetical protein RMI04_09560, partial [Thermofilaceae archaeon]|nr:hypothetical protein [Thermofilaceae archaeon]